VDPSSTPGSMKIITIKGEGIQIVDDIKPVSPAELVARRGGNIFETNIVLEGVSTTYQSRKSLEELILESTAPVELFG